MRTKVTTVIGAVLIGVATLTATNGLLAAQESTPAAGGASAAGETGMMPMATPAATAAQRAATMEQMMDQCLAMMKMMSSMMGMMGGGDMQGMMGGGDMRGMEGMEGMPPAAATPAP